MSLLPTHPLTDHHKFCGFFSEGFPYVDNHTDLLINYFQVDLEDINVKSLVEMSSIIHIKILNIPQQFSLKRHSSKHLL